MTFSIRYNKKGGDGYTEYAVDWNWELRNRWACSEKEGVRWLPMLGVDKIAYTAILKKFGLEDEKKFLPLERIINMSPEKLGKIRRAKEKYQNLQKLEIISDTFGNHIEIV
jgi:hypothetical protein